jgi:hypothetical protein
MWQIRAMQLEEQLKQLAAGTEQAEEPTPELAESTESNKTPVQGVSAWLRRLLGG